MIRQKRRWLIVLFTIIVLFTLTSCFGGDPVEPNTPDVPDSNNSDQEPSNLIFYEIKNNYVTIGYEVGGLKDTSLKEVVIPKKYNNLPVIGIRDNAFEDYDSLINITIPDSVINIGEMAFYGCSNLTSIKIGSSVTSIGSRAFYGCSSLTSIILPNSVTIIGDNAFHNCSNLTSIIIGNGITSFVSRAFYNCSSLDKVYYNGTIEDWCKIQFESSYYNSNPMFYAEHFYLRKDNNWEEVTSIEILNTITEIGNYQFCEFNNVTSITIGNSVTSIGEMAFYVCSNLKNITIENKVTSIEFYAFWGCDSLDKIYYNGSIEDWESIEIDSGNDCLINATKYYYSNIEPSDNGHYWHYDSNGNVVEW